MLEHEFTEAALRLASYISAKNFAPITQHTPYYHMGATIVDSVLQAGLNYRHVVYPRVLKLLQEYPQYATTCDFLILIQVVPLQDLVNWRNHRKLETIEHIAWLLYNRHVENEDQLSHWLEMDDSISCLLRIGGVGPKTVDYMKMLSGRPSIAIDRHLFKFLELAGVTAHTYVEAHSVYIKAAEVLKRDVYELDRQVWQYMSAPAIRVVVNRFCIDKMHGNSV